MSVIGQSWLADQHIMALLAQQWMTEADITLLIMITVLSPADYPFHTHSARSIPHTRTRHLHTLWNRHKHNRWTEVLATLPIASTRKTGCERRKQAWWLPLTLTWQSLPIMRTLQRFSTTSRSVGVKVRRWDDIRSKDSQILSGKQPLTHHLN